MTSPRADAPPLPPILEEVQRGIRDYYDELGADRERWIARSRYYYDRVHALLRSMIPPGKTVLDIGCGSGDALATVAPATGVGIDLSQSMVDLAHSKYPQLRFECQSAEALCLEDLEVQNGGGGVDFITLVNAVGELSDVLGAFKRLRPLARPDTRIVIVYYNHFYEPLAGPAARLGLKLDNPTQNWLSLDDLSGFLEIAGFEVVTTGSALPLPMNVPLLAPLANDVVGKIPILDRLGFVKTLVARPLVPLARPPERHSVSVVVPCRNEEDNVDAIPKRVPKMGAFTEIVFVDDQSTDATAARVKAMMAAQPDARIQLATGPGEGKGAAVRAGMEVATGDVLMILDADMTVLPEDLSAFFEAITENRGEFINGTRMVYPLFENAMRPANIIGNKLFAVLFSLLLGQRITDTLCGTKVVMRHDYEKIAASRPLFRGVDLWGDYDWIFGAAKNNLRIVELPVHYVERVAGETKMNRRLGNAWVMLKMCWVAFRTLR
jgi:SAM-dependent methyltransferase/GT2 family glycosyltransferase